MSKKRPFVYMMASRSGVLYVGVTTDLEGRVWQHKNGEFEGFSKKYKCHLLVWFEEFVDIREAIDREKQIKKWRRAKKVFLIELENPGWEDLASNWLGGSLK